MIDAADHGFPLGGQSGKDQRDRGAQIGRHHPRAFQPLDARHSGRATVNVNPRTHAHQFGRMHEAVFKDLFFQHRNPVGGAQKRHHLRLKIGGKTGEGFGDDIHRAHPVAAPLDLQAA